MTDSLMFLKDIETKSDDKSTDVFKRYSKKKQQNKNAMQGKTWSVLILLIIINLTLGASPATAPHGENGASSSRQRTAKK